MEYLKKIQKHGWHANGIAGEGSSPTWTYSVGLFAKYGQPELMRKQGKKFGSKSMVRPKGYRLEFTRGESYGNDQRRHYSPYGLRFVAEHRSFG
ncbi:MAG: DUF4262 domain-containing protein [Pirellula sp.]